MRTVKKKGALRGAAGQPANLVVAPSIEELAQWSALLSAVVEELIGDGEPIAKRSLPAVQRAASLGLLKLWLSAAHAIQLGAGGGERDPWKLDIGAVRQANRRMH